MCRGLHLTNSSVLFNSKWQWIWVCAHGCQALWPVPHLAGVDHMSSLSLLDIPGMEGQIQETITSQSLTAGMISLRGLKSMPVVKPLSCFTRRAFQEGSMKSLLKILYPPVDSIGLLGCSFVGGSKLTENMFRENSFLLLLPSGQSFPQISLNTKKTRARLFSIHPCPPWPQLHKTHHPRI